MSTHDMNDYHNLCISKKTKNKKKNEKSTVMLLTLNIKNP